MLRGLILFTLLAQGSASGDSKCTNEGGTCQYTPIVCRGTYHKGKCSSPSSRQCCIVTADSWGGLCAGNPSNKVRGTDKFGSGAYGASRGGSKHKGVDVVCTDGSTVYAPFSGILVRRENPYGNGNAIDNGVLLEGSGYCVKIFYIAPDNYTGNFLKGQKIGCMLKMQSVYPGITSHVHIQMCDTSINPKRYL